jgi:hypothetical protein
MHKLRKICPKFFIRQIYNTFIFIGLEFIEKYHLLVIIYNISI